MKILNLLPSVLKAINFEIQELANRRNEITLFNGEFIKKVDDYYIYRFEIPEGVSLNYVDTVELVMDQHFDNKIKGEIINIENQFVFIKTKVNIGEKINTLIIIWQSDIILRKLKERVEDIQRVPDDYYLSTVDNLFYPESIGTSPWRNSLILPQKIKPNEDQLNAINLSLKNSICFIWGPPGTGKTQTLGMIAYNLIKSGKRILFASNTNRAVDVGVLALINRYSENEDDFIKEITRYGQIALVENENLWKASFEKQVELLREEMKSKIEKEINLLRIYRKVKSEYIVLTEKVNRLHNVNQSISEKENQFKSIIYKLKELKSQISNFENSNFITSIKHILSGVSKENLESQFTQFQTKGRLLKTQIDELKREKTELEEQTKNIDLIKQKYNSCKSKIDNYGGEKKLEEIIETGLTIDEFALIKEKYFIGATLAKIVMNELFWKLKFDVFIVDEASMVNLPFLYAIASLAKSKVIIIGDPLQLPPISISKKNEVRRWFENDIFSFVSQATSVESLFKWNQENQHFIVFLSIQYRMASDLCSLISKFFYKNQLVNGINESDKNGDIIFANTSALSPVTQKAHGSKFKPYNKTHAIKIINAINHAISKDIYSPDDIGIILPFTYSVTYIRKVLRENNLSKIEVGTIHTFQGREKNVIIFDTVMAGVNYTVRPFDEVKTSQKGVSQLLNVALSRSKKDIYIIADLDHFERKYVGKIINRLLFELNKISNKVNDSINYQQSISDDKEIQQLLG